MLLTSDLIWFCIHIHSLSTNAHLHKQNEKIRQITIDTNNYKIDAIFDDKQTKLISFIDLFVHLHQ